jgi:mono/diheme cytochrome c family protein
MSWLRRCAHAVGNKPVLAGVIVVVGVLLVVGGILIFSGRKQRDQPPPPPEGDRLAAGKQLYGSYCAQCHGDKGDGNGPAAKFLYPKPRDFGEAKFRLVTTTNRVPSDDDLMRVISRGMPGSAMFPFDHLSESDRQALVTYVRHLTRTTKEELFRRQAEEEGTTIRRAELTKLVNEYTVPDSALEVPDHLPTFGPESVARGQAIYLKQCSACHGPTGKGDGAQVQHDDNGMPTRPRDFTRGIFKGGKERQQLYARIALGLPGTPMPGSPDLKPADMGDLINYVLSLSESEAHTKVEHKRTQLVAKRVRESLAKKIADDTWKAAPAIPIVVSPLWWRDYTPPELEVQALHDGTTLAIRLSWKDELPNQSVSRPEDFEDMAAVQLFKGNPEPFLGMGSDTLKPDLWLWRASWQRPASDANAILDDYPLQSPNYLELLKGKDVPDFLTARAAGNPHAHADREQSASSLVAGGFGSTTFRPQASQQVTAHSTRKEGRWTVVLQRPLQVEAKDGISLAAGDRCSIAFALWDGEARDRNGQKLISIWHGLKLE